MLLASVARPLSDIVALATLTPSLSMLRMTESVPIIDTCTSISTVCPSRTQNSGVISRIELAKRVV